LSAIWVIAQNTFKENIRNRIMAVILLFAVGLIMLSSLISKWSLNEQVKILQDFGLAAISIFGLLIAMFVGVRTFYQEVERKTIYMLVSKPISRWQIILGKYAGLAGTILLNITAITVTLLCVNYFLEGSVAWRLLPAIGLIALEIFLVISWAIFFSTITSSLLSSVLTFVVYIIGHMAPDIMLYTKLHPDAVINPLMKFLYTVVPNLENFNIKTAVVGYMPLPPNAIEFAVLYGLAYITLMLGLTAIIFEKKDLR
jgi:ABC-type transport system involved in multi-copper enzyme maturation permease subunit